MPRRYGKFMAKETAATVDVHQVLSCLHYTKYICNRMFTNTSTHRIGGCVGSTARQDTVETFKKKL
jgi:hypothetical protein